MSQVLNNPIPLPVESAEGFLSRALARVSAFKAFVILIAVIATIIGLNLRTWAWNHSEGVRFNGDISNGYNWGSFVLQQSAQFLTAPTPPGKAVPLVPFYLGYRSAYDAVEQNSLHNQQEFRLDYTPLRLLVMSLWARHEHALDPSAAYWRPELTPPLLAFNTACELASCVAVFLLVWHWRGRSTRAAWILGLIGALFVWFDPSVILDDHMWPQWDVWLLPFYLWAAYCCSTRRWFIAGFLLAIGAMLKGQVMMIAPLFAMWALFELEFVRLLRLIGGFAAGTALVVAPFLVQSANAAWFIAGATLLAALISLLLLRRKSDAIAIAACVFAVGVVLVGVRFGGSWSWYHVGFKYPMDHFRTPAAGTVNNLPAIFGVRYSWRLYDSMMSIVSPWSGREFVVTFQLALRIVYFIFLTLCAVGLTIQSKRKSPAALIGFAAPWVIMFAFTPQMHCRYLVWGAVATSLCVGVSLGLTLLHILVTAMSAGMFLDTMLKVNPETAPKLLRVLQGMEPDLGWTISLIALIYLYLLLKPGTRGDQGSRSESAVEPSSIATLAQATGARSLRAV